MSMKEGYVRGTMRDPRIDKERVNRRQYRS